MATITFESYFGASPQWTNLGANRLVFCGSLTDIAAMILAANFQDGTHVGSGTPGADQCTTNHVPNVKYLSNTTMSRSGGGSETISDAALGSPNFLSCTLRVHFNDSVARSIQNGRFYCFDGSVVTNPAVGVDVAAWECQNSFSSWFHLNDYSTSGASGWQTGNVGGDNSGERISMGERPTAAQDQYWYYALSASPESAGSKANFAFGVYLEYY